MGWKHEYRIEPYMYKAWGIRQKKTSDKTGKVKWIFVKFPGNLRTAAEGMFDIMLRHQIGDDEFFALVREDLDALHAHIDAAVLEVERQLVAHRDALARAGIEPIDPPESPEMGGE